MPSMTAKGALAAAILGAGALLAGCAQTTRHLSADFGSAIKEDVAAQIADPDAHYAGIPAPGADGARTTLAQDRYRRDAVIQPASPRTSSVSVAGGGGGSAGVSGGGTSQ